MADWEKFTYSASDGLQLAGRAYGWANRDALPVVCLAGLTRNAADFHDIALYLANEAEPRRRVLSLDYRGRGMSQHDRNWHNYNILTEADDVLAGMTAAGLEHAAVIGTSRGGLVIFALTALRPGALKAAVLNDVGPQIDGRGLVRIKKYLDNPVSYKSLEEAGRTIREFAHSQFPDWDLQMWIKQAGRILEVRDGKVHRLYDTNLVRTLAALNLDNPLPNMWPQFEALAQIPVMAIRGQNSDLLSAEILAEMGNRHPQLEAMTIPAQGHAPDLGTAGIPARIAEFLSALH